MFICVSFFDNAFVAIAAYVQMGLAGSFFAWRFINDAGIIVGTGFEREP